MSGLISIRWACAPAAIGRCARVGEARKKVSTESSGKVIGRQKRAHKHESVSEHCEAHRRRGATKYIPGTTARLRGHQCEHLTSIAADLAERARSQSIRAYLPICIVEGRVALNYTYQSATAVELRLHTWYMYMYMYSIAIQNLTWFTSRRRY